tara:strand:+ start:231 stop:668 length:438 start_codon:yes stop_codon:yes gene_type:complete
MNSERLTKMLKRHEGVKSHAYKCSAGFITVGVGRNLDENGGIGLSDSEIDMLLANDIARVDQELKDRFVWYSELDSVRRDAMIDIAFNLGITKLLRFEKALSAMESQDYFLASEEFNDSRWSDQVGERADELCDMIETGEYRAAS